MQNQTIRIPLYRTFTNWIIIVVIGSVLLPFVGQFLGGPSELTGPSNNSFEYTFRVIPVCAMASALCSLPALIMMFVTHLLLNRNETNFRNHQLIQNTVHIGAAILTFTVMKIIMGNDNEGLFNCIVITYPTVGLAVWNITYMIYRNKQNVVPENKEILDEI